jgi:hypothetical protein
MKPILLIQRLQDSLRALLPPCQKHLSYTISRQTLEAAEDALDAAETALAADACISSHPEPDPAASFAAGMSVYEKFRDLDADRDTLSDVYGGFDEFMRQCIRVGTLFEEWACRNIKFEALEDVWPYTLHDNFGTALAAILDYDGLESFNESHCETLATSFEFPRR